MTLRIEKLTTGHPVDPFDCGQAPLNEFLARYALMNQRANMSATYVALADAEVVGFYTLVVGSVAPDDAVPRLLKGVARHPVPVMLLARLATSSTWQGQGVGKGMLKDAVLRTLQAAEIAGIRAMTVHAKDEAARAFYERYDFKQSPSDPMHLMVLLKDLRALVQPGLTSALPY